MNVTRENLDELNAVLKVKVVADDYLPKVKSALRDYQKKEVVKGFRPGKVPAGLIEKKYGRAIKWDEIQKVLNNSLQNYLKENKIDFIGHPIPQDMKEHSFDIDNDDFEFLYDMGLTPAFSVSISPEDKIGFQTIKIDDELLDKNINGIAKRYGKVMQKEISENGDLLYGDFVQLNEAGEEVEGGINKAGSLFIDKIKDETVKNLFVGRKKEDKIVANSQHLSDNKTDLAALLGIEKSVAEILNCNIQFTVKEITHLAAAEINMEFIDRVMGPGNVNSVEEFREKMRENFALQYLHESDDKFYYEAIDYLLKKVNMNLPDRFLKRYIAESTKETPTDIENEFEKYRTGVKWQLIQNRIASDNHIVVTEEDMLNYIKNNIASQYGMEVLESVGVEELENIARKTLEKEDEAKKIHNDIFEFKLKEFLKSKFTLETKEVDYNVFYNVKN